VGRASAAAALLCVLVGGCAEAPPSAPPNVIVVCIDSLRADRLAIYGGPEATSRTFAAIAREGVVFDRAFTVASWTKPSVASLLTGLYPSQHGLIASHETRVDLLPDAVTTLAETLHAGGYRTAAFVENVHLQRKQSALDQGFEVYAEEVGSAREIINGFAAWVGQHDPRPFFAYLHVLDPHWPYAPLPPPAGRPLADDVALRRLHWDLDGGRWPLLRDAVNEQGLRLTAAELSAVTALYDGEIYDVDAALASLLELLRGRGLLEQTLLVVTADHGEGFLDRGRLDHGYGAYDELARIPLLVRLPGGEHGGRRVGEPAQIVDVAPTILDFAGIDAPALGGRSLRAAITGKRMPEHGGIIAEEVHGSITLTALQTARFKYLRSEDLEPRGQGAGVPRLPADLRVGVRVRMEGIAAQEAFVADEIKRVGPGDEDCEMTVPLATLDPGAETAAVLGFSADIRGISAKERAILTSDGRKHVVWAHVQGNRKNGMLVVDDVDRVDVSLPEIELEGLVDVVDVSAAAVSLSVCGMRVLVSGGVRWKEFAASPESSPAVPAAIAAGAPAVREELYDLNNDPHERTNVAAESPEVAAKLASRLAARRAELLAAVAAPERRSVELSDDVRRRLQALGYAE